MIVNKIKDILVSKNQHFISIDFKTYKKWKFFIKLAVIFNKNYKKCEIYRNKFKSKKDFVVVGLRYNGRNVRRRTSGWAKGFIKKNKGIRCIYCGVELTDDNVTADHIVPISKGGNNSQVNLVACCKSCNNERGNMNFKKFYLNKRNDNFKIKYIKI